MVSRKTRSSLSKWNGLPRRRDEGSLDLRGEPLLGGRIAVDKHGPARPGFLHEGQKLLAWSVSTEVVDLNPAVELDLRKAFIQPDWIARAGGSNLSSGAVRIGVTYKEQHVPWIIDEATGKSVGSGLLGHHAAGERVDRPGLQGYALAAPSAAGDEVHVA